MRNLSYSANGETKITGGDSATEQLVPELALGLHKHDAPGLVSLFVKEEAEREVKERLIARDGKLVTVTEETGAAPNGTAFAITLQADPEFDATNLVVGRVVEGLEIVEQVIYKVGGTENAPTEKTLVVMVPCMLHISACKRFEERLSCTRICSPEIRIWISYQYTSP